jgi:hypothetical protein
MKKYISPVAAGGAPLNNERFINELGSEFWNAIESILQGVSDPAATGNVGVIVSGCKITGGGPYNCSAGIVYLAGQFMAFPGFTGQSLPQYILPATLVQIPKVFFDGVSRNLINQQDATYQAGVPGAGQYISLTTTGNLGAPGGFRLENVSNPGVTAAILVETNARIAADAALATSLASRDTNWISTAIGTSNLVNDFPESPTSVAQGSIDYRRDVKETFVRIYFKASFTHTSNFIRVTNIPANLDSIFSADPMISGGVLVFNGNAGTGGSNIAGPPAGFTRSAANTITIGLTTALPGGGSTASFSISFTIPG